MASIKIVIHPLFFIFGLYFAFIGKVFSFLIFTLSALIHELGHSFISEKLGYKLNRIVLMPYGALISGDLSNLKYKDECLISIAGPLINCFICLIFVALWWLFPESYIYTDLIVFANISLAIINLLPAFPLDGGRFLRATLCLVLPFKKSDFIVRLLGYLLSFILLLLFIFSCFTAVNFTILFFSAFVFFGAIDQNKQNRYIKIFESLNNIYIKHPTEIKKIAINYNFKVKDLYKLINNNYLFEIYIFDNDGNIFKKFNVKKTNNVLINESPYTLLKNIK